MTPCPFLNSRRDPCPTRLPDDVFCAKCGREYDVEEPADGARVEAPSSSSTQAVRPATGSAAPVTVEATATKTTALRAAGLPTGTLVTAVDNARQFVPDKCRTVSCNATSESFDEDGFCTKCWVQTVRPGRDDFIIDLGPKLVARSFIGETTTGEGHRRNEDYVAMDTLEVDGKTVIWAVVCDGMSHCSNPQTASEVACKAAAAALREAALAGVAGSEALVSKAIDAAQAEVVKVAPEPGSEETQPPACTIVVILIKDGFAYLGWCGDSRIYAIHREGSTFSDQLLSRDHTLLNEKIDLEGITLEEAYKQFDVKELHTMVQCLGEVPEGERFAPSFKTVPIDPSVACIFGCSDGAWNDVHAMDSTESTVFASIYAQSNGNVKAFAETVLAKASGYDNISVAVVSF